MNSPSRDKLPINLYSAESVRQLDALAINEFKIAGYELMKRAGQSAFHFIQDTYPIARRMLVICGAGNNAGDGYVVARLAIKAGLDVTVVSMIEGKRLKGDAYTAWHDWHSLGRQAVPFSAELLLHTDVVVDAMLGTGLQRDVEGKWAELITAVNDDTVPVVSMDIPSGLCPDTGRVAGAAIRADATVTFIGLKKGMFTHLGVDHCGELKFDDLQIPHKVYEHVPPQAQLLEWPLLKYYLRPRAASSHKHQCGHVVIMGGDLGMPGAVRMAAEAALRAGAGLVTVVSHAEHAPIILSGRPEIMLCPSEDGHVSADVMASADALVVGPGMTDSQWSQHLLSAALESHVPKVVDAGALRMLSIEDGPRSDWILTPHPGEAAALLGEASEVIQASRFSSTELIQSSFGGLVILKGAGSLLCSEDGMIQLCPYGNPGMASAGMGDVLSGVLASLLAQGYSYQIAARLGVCIHSMAADSAAAQGEKGLLACDLFPYIRQLVNLQ